ncbi:MAG: hypothetical protein ACREPR_09930, partial [Brasilonema sp.]
MVLLTLILTTTWIPTAIGQISLFSEQNDNKVYQTPWWDLNKARPCGRLVCSHVYLPGTDNFTVASEIGTDRDEAMSALAVEKRAKLIEETVSSIFGQSANSRKTQKQGEQTLVNLAVLDPSKIHWQYLLFSNNKDLHPLTPKIEVGIKNEQTVVYVPAQPKLGLLQQTIVTVTEADSLNDGAPMPTLAQDWRNIIRQSLSESLWGYELDARYPFVRLMIIAAIAVGTLVSIWMIHSSKRLFKAPERKCTKQLQELQQ